MLCEQGLLDLDTPLSRYLPEPYLPDEPALEKMTARHVLSHTGGFPNWRGIDGLRALFQPGTSFHYSTEGLIYLQTVIEYKVGQPIEQILHRNVFSPFDMTDSRLEPEELSQFLPYLPSGRRAYGPISLNTTVLDYARFLIEMAWPGHKNERLLGPAFLAEVFRPHTQVGSQAGLSWGLGWGLQHTAGEEDSFWHWGARRNQTRSLVIGFPIKRSAIVIFTNQANGLEICEGIAQTGLDHPEPFPAFRWLLPAEQWRGDGLKN